MCNFTRTGRKKKVVAFDNSGMKAVWAAQLGTTPKRWELQLFFAAIWQDIWRWKALDLRSLNMYCQQDWSKDKKVQLFNFLQENKKNCSTELYGAPLDGSTFFLYGSSSDDTVFKSYRLAELKYACFSRTRRKTKKLTALEALSIHSV